MRQSEDKEPEVFDSLLKWFANCGFLLGKGNRRNWAEQGRPDSNLVTDCLPANVHHAPKLYGAKLYINISENFLKAVET